MVLPASDIMAQSSLCLQGFLGQQKQQIVLECCNVLHVGKNPDVCGMKVCFSIKHWWHRSPQCQRLWHRLGQLLLNECLYVISNRIYTIWRKRTGRKGCYKLLATLYVLPSSLGSMAASCPWIHCCPWAAAGLQITAVYKGRGRWWRWVLG